MFSEIKEGIKIWKAFFNKTGPEAVSECMDLLSDKDYAYSTIAEYEEITGLSVNDAFRIGWDMARVTNAQLRKL